MRGKSIPDSQNRESAPRFSRRPGEPVRVTYGGSGTHAGPHEERMTAAQWQAAADSGMVSRFVPAQRTKPLLRRFIQTIQTQLDRYIGEPPAGSTTQQGTPASAEPSVYQFELTQLRYERRAIIEETRRMYADDPRIRQSVDQFAEEACRDGFNIVIHNKKKLGSMLGTILKCRDDVTRALHTEIAGNAKMLMVEGDLFVQWCIDPSTRRITGAKRMPASAMERNSDDADEFPDPANAFSQVGTMTNTEYATFSRAVISHLRYDHVPGDKYGNSRLLAVRRQWRLLKLQEDAQARRRMIRAAQHIIWNLGTPDKPGDVDAINEFKALNGWVEGNRDQWDPTEVGRDFFGNGLLDAKILEGDQTVHQIDDIEYTQDVLMSGLPTPAALLPVAAKLINRDVLKDQRSQWLLSTKRLSNMLRDDLVAYGFELALLLQGIDPEIVQYTAHFSESAVETATEIINRVLSLRKNTLGTGPNAIPDPMITVEQAQQLMSEVLGIKDPEEAVKQLFAERSDWTKLYGEIMEMRTPEPHAPVPSLPGNRNPSVGVSRNGNGAAKAKTATNGHRNGTATAVKDSETADEEDLIDPLSYPYGTVKIDLHSRLNWNGPGNPTSLWYHVYGSGPDTYDQTQY